MATKRVCDCCGRAPVKRYAFNEGLGIVNTTGWDTVGADLCESCVVALRFKWDELSRTGPEEK